MAPTLIHSHSRSLRYRPLSEFSTLITGKCLFIRGSPPSNCYRKILPVSPTGHLDGESGAISVSVGVGEEVVVDIEKRGLDMIRGDDGQKNEVVSGGLL